VTAKKCLKNIIFNTYVYSEKFEYDHNSVLSFKHRISPEPKVHSQLNLQ